MGKTARGTTRDKEQGVWVGVGGGEGSGGLHCATHTHVERRAQIFVHFHNWQFYLLVFEILYIILLLFITSLNLFLLLFFI